MDFDSYWQSKCIYNNMFFFAFYFLSPIDTIFTAIYMMRGSYASRIYESDTWADSFTACFANYVTQMMHKLLKKTF